MPTQVELLQAKSDMVTAQIASSRAQNTYEQLKKQAEVDDIATAITVLRTPMPAPTPIQDNPIP